MTGVCCHLMSEVILPKGLRRLRVWARHVSLSSEGLAYDVRRVSREDCAPFILDIHYARRWCSISHAFGLFEGDQLVGVVTYGTPPSAPLRKGVAGPEFESNVIELNRLCLKNNKKNEASMLVGRSLKLLKGDFIVVSFADTSKGHSGIVYQATNFSYHGLSAKRTDWKVRGKEHLHGQTIADEFRGQKGRAKLMRDKYGDDFYLAPRPRKHRYIRVVGDKRFRKAATKAIRYKMESHP